MIPERPDDAASDGAKSSGTGREAPRKGKIPKVLWAGAMVLTSVCVWLQTTPDLFDELPRTLLVWLTMLGAFGQAITAVVYPEIAAMLRNRRRHTGAEQPSNDLIPPRKHLVGYEAERARISRMFARFPPPGWRRMLHPVAWRDEDNTQPALVVVITGAPGTGKSQLANGIARQFQRRFPHGVRRIDLQGDRTDLDDSDLQSEDVPAETVSGEGATSGDPERGRRRILDPFGWIRNRSEPETGGTDDTTVVPELASESQSPVGPWAPRNAYSLLEEALDSIGGSPPTQRRNLEKTWRRLTASRRLLLVLENAAGPEQIRPLIPNNSLSAVLVTSRRSFDDVHDFDLDTVTLTGLADEVGLDLLEKLAPIGEPPAEAVAEREVRREIVARCGTRPIALSWCGTRLDHRSGDGSRELLTALAGQDNPLVNDPDPEGFRASFTAAFQQCAPLGRLLLRRMAVTGMYQVADYSAAALLDLPCGEAQEVLHELDARFLVDALGKAEDDNARYQLHQLAADTLRTSEPAAFDLPDNEERAWSTEATLAARERLVHVYTWLTEQVAQTLNHTHDGFGEESAAPTELVDRLELVAPTRPQAWLDRDREFLLECVWLAGNDGLLDTGRRLARAFAAICQSVRTYWHEWGQAVRAQRQLAEAEGRRHAAAMAMLDESEFSGSRGDYDRGVALAKEARDAFEAQGAHPRWQARALRALGGNLQRRNDLDEARHELEHAESIFARHQETWWRARTRCHLAEVETHVGRFAEAQHLLEEARDAFDGVGDSDYGQHARILLAEVLGRRQHDLEAWTLLHQVRTLALEQGKEGHVARCLRAMGVLNSDNLERQYLELTDRGERPREKHLRVPGSTAWHMARARRRSWSHRTRVAMLNESIELLDRMGDMWGVQWSRMHLGLILVRSGAFTKGSQELDRATEGFAELPDWLWKAQCHHIIAAQLFTAALSYAPSGTDTSDPRPVGIGVAIPNFDNRIKMALEHARSAADTYAQINDHAGQVRAQLLLARIRRVGRRGLEQVEASLAKAEHLADTHGMLDAAEQARELRAHEDDAKDHATVAQYWPIS